MLYRSFAKAIGLVIFLSFCGWNSFAQEKEVQSYIPLTAGKSWSAEVLSQQEVDLGERLFEETRFVPKPIFLKPKAATDSERKLVDKKHYNIILFGALISGVGTDPEGGTLGINLPHYIHGIRIHRLLKLGLGIGIDAYQPEFIPIYLDVRGSFLDRDWTPYYSLNIGYGFSADLLNNFNAETTSLRGGLLFHPAVGIRIATRNNYDILVELGYKQQKGQIRNENRRRRYVYRWTYRRVSFRFGILF